MQEARVGLLPALRKRAVLHERGETALRPNEPIHALESSLSSFESCDVCPGQQYEALSPDSALVWDTEAGVGKKTTAFFEEVSGNPWL